MKHSIVMMSVDTKTCPYVNVGKNGFSFVFVIGRDGRIVWKGNHTVKDKDYFKAVNKALAVKPAPALDRAFNAALDAALANYYSSRFSESRKEAQKVAKKYSRKQGDSAAGIREDAAFLIKQIDARADELLGRMEKSLKSGDGAAFAKASADLTAGFAGTDALARAKVLLRETTGNTLFTGELKAADAWHALLKKRPLLFPARRDKTSKAYARKLEKYLKTYKEQKSAAAAGVLLEEFRNS
jgi:hypothetical protein